MRQSFYIKEFVAEDFLDFPHKGNLLPLFIEKGVHLPLVVNRKQIYNRVCDKRGANDCEKVDYRARDLRDSHRVVYHSEKTAIGNLPYYKDKQRHRNGAQGIEYISVWLSFHIPSVPLN
jgi:hypothetical protein